MKGFFMLILFCQNKLISKTFSESLAPFSPVICESEEDFLERLPSAKLAIIDENIQLYQKSYALNYPQTFLLTLKQQKILDDEVSVLYKPLRLSDLTQKVSLLLNQAKKGISTTIQTNLFVYNGATHTITIKETEKNIPLTQRENEIILYLFENKDKTISKDDLLTDIFGYREDTETHTVETHIYKLRQKIGDLGDKIIITQNGGYCLNLD